MKTRAALFLVGAGVMCMAATLSGQSILCVVQGEKVLPVRKMMAERPTVAEKGKLIETVASRYVLAPATDYAPLLVTVRDLSVSAWGENSDTNTRANTLFRLRAEFESVYRLEDLFLAVELETADAGRRIFAYEVGTLESRVARRFETRVPIEGGLRLGRYELHLFVKGVEVLHTMQPFEAREAALDRMVAKRISGLMEAAPQPFFTPPPQYPAALRTAPRNGQALLSFRIATNGAVFEPAVEAASHPAFGEAALAAVRPWRFLPKMEGGKPIVTRVTLPIDFESPRSATNP